MAIRAAEHERTQEVAARLEVALLVARGAPVEEVFGAASEQAARLLAVETGAVVRYVGAERAVVTGVWRAGGTRGFPVNAELDFDSGNSALGRLRATGRPARADGYEGLRGELPLVMRSIGLRASAATPIRLGRELWGALVVSTTAETLPPGGEDRIGALADLVGQALENAEAARRVEQSRLELVEAADESRRRLERDLHEGAQQHLVALALKLRVARARAETGSTLAGLIDDALAEALEANAALRDLARGLHPAVLTERGLAAALQALAARTSIPVNLRELPARRFAPTVEATAYFIVSEVLDNAAAHSGAEEVVLEAADRGDRLVIELRDAGAGGADPARGSGLRALAHRAAALGGRFAVDSPRGGGTAVRVELPVAQRA